MSRKQIDGKKWVVRLDKKSPSPYLKKHLDKIVPSNKNLQDCIVMDIGCGNGRNSVWLAEQGVSGNILLDQYPEWEFADLIFPCNIGSVKFPDALQIDIFLANYILMFLPPHERWHVIREVKRIAQPHARIMVELYKAVDGYARTDREILDIQRETIENLGWKKIIWSKGRFIAANE